MTNWAKMEFCFTGQTRQIYNSVLQDKLDKNIALFDRTKIKFCFTGQTGQKYSSVLKDKLGKNEVLFYRTN